jgi:hypothetical protein
MAVPRLLPTVAEYETVAGITYHIDGELVPVLQLELSNLALNRLIGPGRVGFQSMSMRHTDTK